MTNRLKSNPIYFDGFNADATLSETNLCVKKIRVLSAGDGDIFKLEDNDGNVVFDIVNTGAADTVECDFGDEGFIFSNGVLIDVSDCTGMATTDGSDAVWVYLK